MDDVSSSDQVLARERSKNLRQLLHRAMRVLNGLLLSELERRGYSDVRLSHTFMLMAIDMDGTRLSDVADRTGMTKQAASTLSQELEERGYLTRQPDEDDARSRILMFTHKGVRLMFDSFAAIEEIERRYANMLGEQTMDELRRGLAAFIGANQVS